MLDNVIYILNSVSFLFVKGLGGWGQITNCFIVQYSSE